MTPASRDVWSLFCAHAYYKATTLALYLVMAKTLPPKAIGTYFFVFALSQVFLVVASLNLGPLLLRRISAHPESGGAQLSSLLSFRALTFLPYLGVLALAVTALDSGLLGLVLVAGVSALLEDLYFHFGSAFVGLRRVGWNIRIGLTVHTLFLAGCALALWLWPLLEVLVAVHALRSLLLFLAAHFFATRHFGPLRPRSSRSLLDGFGPFATALAFSALYQQIDALLVASFLGYDDLGAYQLAMVVVGAAGVVPAIVGMIAFREIAAGAPPRKVLGPALFWIGLAGALVALLLAWLAHPIARFLYGPMASEVAPLLERLWPLVLLSFLNILATMGLQAIGAEAMVPKITMLGALSLMSLGIAFIPSYGADGAVWARTTATLGQAAVAVTWLWWSVRARPAA